MSARAWEPGAWEEFWAEVDDQEWLAARAVLEVSARVRGVAETFVYRDERPLRDKPRGEALLDWEGFAAQVSRAGLSSGEARLADLVVALTTGAVIELEPLSRLGSWGPQVWRVLARWGTGQPVDPAPDLSVGPATGPAAGGRP
jgi:hypothetical protein